MRHIRPSIYTILVLIGLLLSALAVLLITPMGTNILIKAVGLSLPGQLKIERIEGSITKGISFTELTYTDAMLDVHIIRCNLDWKMTLHPWHQTILIDNVHIGTLQVHASDTKPIKNKAHRDIELPSIPFDLQVNRLTIDELQIGQIKLDQLQIQASLNNKQLNIALTSGENSLNITGNLPDQLQCNASISQPQFIHPALANLRTNISVKGEITGSQRGKLTIAITPGLFQTPGDSSIPPIPFKGGTLSVILKPNMLQAIGHFTLNPNEIIDMSLRLPEFEWMQATSLLSQSLDGEVKLNVGSLDFLHGLSPMVSDLRGQLSACLTIKGTLGNPDVQGTLKLLDGGLSIPDAGVTFNSIQVTLASHNKHWEAMGSIGNNDGHEINVKGKGEFSPRLHGSVSITADNFPAFKTAEYTIHLSPQLTMNIDNEKLDITGTIVVPTARFKPMLFSNTLNLTDDAVFVSNETAKKSSPVHVNTDIYIKIGDDVVIDAEGLHGFLGGEVQITRPPAGPMIVDGELTIHDGSYKAYGQDLAIKDGQLLFSGATPSNPKISLRAVRTFNNTSQFSGSNQLFDFNASNIQTIDFGNHVMVGVEVGGYLNAPKVRLFSVPSSLSQADILSLILLGKPANQASHSGGQLLLTAMSAMNLNSGTKGLQLLSQLKQALGVDFNVQSNAKSNQTSNTTASDTSFVVGKSLSKRLYLSYNIGVFQENSNVLILKYLLNKYFSFQVTASSTGNGMDFLYTAQP